MSHYPYKAPDAAMRAALSQPSPWSSCSYYEAQSEASGYNAGKGEEARSVTLPSLTEDGKSQASLARAQTEPVGDKSQTDSGPGNKRAAPRKTFFKPTAAMTGPSAPACLTKFGDWCQEKYGNMVRVFRLLDKAANMKLSKVEFKMGLTHLMYKQDLDKLWQIFDRDQTGWVSFLHFAAEDAVVLSYFKHWADSKFGSSEDLFRALDTQKDGKLTVPEFCKGLKRLGFQTADNTDFTLRTLFELIDDAGDVDSKKSITVKEMAFLDRWECPEYMWCQPDYDAKVPFLKATIERFRNNPLLAWRKALDTDGSMRVSYYEFIKAYKSMSSRKLVPEMSSKHLPALFRALDRCCCGWLSLRDFDEATYNSLVAFSKWATESFGKVSLSCKALAGPEDGDKVKFQFFKKGVKAGLGLNKDEAWRLFEGLSLESKKGGTIKPDELFFLDRWDFKAEIEEEMAWDRMMTDIESQLLGDQKFHEIYQDKADVS